MHNLLAGLADLDHNAVDSVLFALVALVGVVVRALLADLLRRVKSLEEENRQLRTELGSKAKSASAGDDAV